MYYHLLHSVNKYFKNVSLIKLTSLCKYYYNFTNCYLYNPKFIKIESNQFQFLNKNSKIQYNVSAQNIDISIIFI